MKRSFWELLRQRLMTRESEDFDRRFWAKFDQEFSEGLQQKEKFRFAWPKFNIRVWVPAGALAAILLVVFFYRPDSNLSVQLADQKDSPQQDRGAPTTEIFTEDVDPDLIENIDFYLELAEMDAALELSDEDWAALIDEGGDFDELDWESS